MSLVDQDYFAELRPYIFAVRYDRDGGHSHPRYRIELRGPSDVTERASVCTMPCVSCGVEVFPFRRRKAPTGRGKADGALYFAAACSLADRVGCSRGTAASAEYARVRAALEPS